ncbi:DMT family transporter, partial [Psychrobacter alimentarius]
IAGVIYITSALILVPRLGATRFIVCVIAGQMLISLILDQYGFMNLPVKEINAGRLVGVTFVLLGMIMVLWLTPSSPNLGDVKASMTGNLNAIESTPTSNAKHVSHFES